MGQSSRKSQAMDLASWQMAAFWQLDCAASLCRRLVIGRPIVSCQMNRIYSYITILCLTFYSNQCHLTSFNQHQPILVSAVHFVQPDQGWEPFFGHALAPLFAAFLAASAAPAAPGCQSLVVQLLQHEALVALGEFSFEAGTAVHRYAQLCTVRNPLLSCPFCTSFYNH